MRVNSGHTCRISMRRKRIHLSLPGYLGTVDEETVFSAGRVPNRAVVRWTVMGKHEVGEGKMGRSAGYLTALTRVSRCEGLPMRG
jgi:hypothetical protein